MTTHLKKVHPNDEEDWLEPIPDLEGLSVDSGSAQGMCIPN